MSTDASNEAPSPCHYWRSTAGCLQIRMSFTSKMTNSTAFIRGDCMLFVNSFFQGSTMTAKLDRSTPCAEPACTPWQTWYCYLYSSPIRGTCSTTRSGGWSCQRRYGSTALTCCGVGRGIKVANANVVHVSFELLQCNLLRLQNLRG